MSNRTSTQLLALLQTAWQALSGCSRTPSPSTPFFIFPLWIRFISSFNFWSFLTNLPYVESSSSGKGFSAYFLTNFFTFFFSPSSLVLQHSHFPILNIHLLFSILCFPQLSTFLKTSFLASPLSSNPLQFLKTVPAFLDQPLPCPFLHDHLWHITVLHFLLLLLNICNANSRSASLTP